MFVSSSWVAAACLVVTLTQPSVAPSSSGGGPAMSSPEEATETWESLPAASDAENEPATPPTIRFQWQPSEPLDADHLARLRHKQAVSDMRELAIGGWATLGTFYLWSAVAGAAAIDLADGRDDRLHRFGSRMLVPVAGPPLAIWNTQTASGALLTTLAGVGQIVGLGLALAGHIRVFQLRRDVSLTATGVRLRF